MTKTWPSVEPAQLVRYFVSIYIMLTVATYIKYLYLIQTDKFRVAVVNQRMEMAKHRNLPGKDTGPLSISILEYKSELLL